MRTTSAWYAEDRRLLDAVNATSCEPIRDGTADRRDRRPRHIGLNRTVNGLRHRFAGEAAEGVREVRVQDRLVFRSEERRVGKERRGRCEGSVEGESRRRAW